MSQLTAHPAAAPPATLHPLLILLTRLKPAAAAADAALPLAPFAPLLAAACAARPFAVRELAARALCTCVAPQDLPYALREHLAALPERAGPGDANATHGTLCVLRALLSVNAGIGGTAEALRAVNSAVPWLLERVWLADAAHTGCPAVSRAYVQTLAAAARAAERLGDGAAARQLCSERLREGLLQIVAAVRHTHSYAPMWTLWLRELAHFLLPVHVVGVVLAPLLVAGHLQQRSGSANGDTAAPERGQLCADALRLLRCPVMEVRAEALRCLVKRSAVLRSGACTYAKAPHSATAAQSAHSVANGGSDLLEAVLSLSRRDASDKVRRRALHLLAALPPRRACGAAATAQPTDSRDEPDTDRVAQQLAGVELADGLLPRGSHEAVSSTMATGGAGGARITELQSLLQSSGSVRAQPHALVCLSSELGAAWASTAPQSELLIRCGAVLVRDFHQSGARIRRAVRSGGVAHAACTLRALAAAHGPTCKDRTGRRRPS